jgi:integrase
MPRSDAKVLTDATIRAAKPKDARYKLKDAAAKGLYVEVMPRKVDGQPGGKYWRYRFKLAGKEGLYALGEWATAPDAETAEQAADRRTAGRFTLAEARIERQRLADLVRAGQTPLRAKDAAKAAQFDHSANTFEAVSTEFLAVRGVGWSAEWKLRAEKLFAGEDCAPLRPLPVRDITAAAVLAVLRNIEGKGAIAARTAAGLIGQTFRYAIATGRCDSDPTAALRGALKPHKTEHHAPLSRADLPEFFAALAATHIERQTEIALRLLAYTLVRTAELRQAEWGEFDLDNAVWSIPAARMKMDRPHVVPLPTQAVALLRELHTMTGNRQHLFPNVRDPQTCMARSTLNMAIYRMGWQGRFSAHGFRGTASTILHEANFDTRLIELQLAHRDRNSVRASYDHSQRMAERRAMLQSYADTLDAYTVPQSNVVSLRGVA